MHQERVDHVNTKSDFSSNLPYSTKVAHHLSMSTDSTSPIINSDSSFSIDDNYHEVPSPVNETDEIVLRTYYASRAPSHEKYEDTDGTSLWHDLDRDEINTVAVPSFILNSPPTRPMRRGKMGAEYPEELMLYPERKAQAEVTIHSLRKGFTPN
jgi:hypothetical protein